MLYDIRHNHTEENYMAGGIGVRVDRLPRRARRPIAAATLVGLPAMYAWSAYWLTTTVPSIVWGPVSFLLIGMTVIGALVLYRFVRNRADLESAELDERQRLLRDRAHVASYAILSVVVVAILAALAIPVIGFGREIVLDAPVMTAAAISIGTLIPVLPVASLAWIEPDLPEDV